VQKESFAHLAVFEKMVKFNLSFLWSMAYIETIQAKIKLALQRLLQTPCIPNIIQIRSVVSEIKHLSVEIRLSHCALELYKNC